ncbi:MAG: NAD-dependent epimerase/dehydratase family protein [Rhizobiales bacterium]|nr:NAD-dependent epimerase/dehydratase family protein [Hyphomicrobiales bacterium]
MSSKALALPAGATITIFGGSGFLGRHIVQALARQGYRMWVATRRPNQAMFLRPMGDVGQIELVQANIRDDASVRDALMGADAVINLVGILYESGKQKFDSVQSEGAQRVASLAAEQGIRTFIQMSAIGADDDSTSDYAVSKAEGEAAVLKAIPTAVILRPSIVFGPEDDFFNRFAALARISPFLPLIGGGKTKFQPVYVKDVAQAVVEVLARGIEGKIFELGGPEVYSFRDLMVLVLKTIRRERLLLPLPFFAAKFQAFFLQLLPSPLLTVDQVELLKSDNVVSAEAVSEARSLEDLGIVPTSPEAVIGTYLYRFRRTGQYEQITAG